MSQAHPVISLSQFWIQPFLQRVLVPFSKEQHLEGKVWACHCSQALSVNRVRDCVVWGVQVCTHIYIGISFSINIEKHMFVHPYL